jgi:GxxExxY protein
MREERIVFMANDVIHDRKLPHDEERDELTERIISAAIEVHRHLGPGLNESVYEAALCHEFELRGIPYSRQVEVNVIYKGKVIGKTRVDLLVADRVIVELKACDALHPVHRAQCITYLTLTNKTISLLINFSVPILKDGIKRIIRNI